MIKLMLLLCLVSANVFAQEIEPIILPDAADSALSMVFPGWQFNSMDADRIGDFRMFNKRNWPWLWEGDFDGDAHLDYVVHVDYSDSVNVIQSSVIALMRRADRYLVIFVGKGGEGQTLGIEPQGHVLWEDWSDAGTDKPPLWKFEHDTISLGYEGKPTSSYWIWRDDTFVPLYELLY